MRVPVNVGSEGRLLCPCHADPMVESRDQSQARPGETIWVCADMAALEARIAQELASHLSIAEEDA